MDRFDDYLRTLRIFLPKEQRDDIIRELGEEMRAHAADKEAALGRRLRADEQSAIVAQYGHPLITAARYRPQRSLIGPIVFPYYWLLLRVLVGLVVAGHLIGATVLLARGAPLAQMGHVVENLVATVLKVLGWITVLAAVADAWIVRRRVLEKWNPATPFAPARLAVSAVNDALGAIPGRRHERVSACARPSSGRQERAPVTTFVVSVAVSAWWLIGLRFPYLFFGPAAADIEWGAAMNRLYPVLVAAQLLTLASHFVRLTRPDGAGVARLSHLAWLVTGVFFIYFVGTSIHDWIAWRGAAEGSARATLGADAAGRTRSIVDAVNQFLSLLFILIAAAGIVRPARALLHYVSGRGHRAAPA